MKVWARSCVATFAAAMGGLTLATAAAAQQLNVICSVQAEWCTAVANEFQRETGIKVALTLKGSGESMAQLAAEKANPKLDVWFGGTGDPHLQAAEQDLTLAYKSPMLEALQPWPTALTAADRRQTPIAGRDARAYRSCAAARKPERFSDAGRRDGAGGRKGRRQAARLGRFPRSASRIANTGEGQLQFKGTSNLLWNSGVPQLQAE